MSLARRRVAVAAREGGGSDATVPKEVFARIPAVRNYPYRQLTANCFGEISAPLCVCVCARARLPGRGVTLPGRNCQMLQLFSKGKRTRCIGKMKGYGFLLLLRGNVTAQDACSESSMWSENARCTQIEIYSMYPVRLTNFTFLYS